MIHLKTSTFSKLAKDFIHLNSLPHLIANMQSRDPHLSHDFGDSLSHSRDIVIDLLVAGGRVEFTLLMESRQEQAAGVHLSEVMQCKRSEIM